LKKLFAAIALATIVTACGPIRLVSDYDEVIDRGIAEFTELLGAHVKNMAELAGKPEGTYASTLKTYNSLDSKLDVLIFRARNGSDGKGCKLQSDVFSKIQALLKDMTPPALTHGSDASASSANECSSRLLDLVKLQLADIRKIHADVDKCGPQVDVSCLRPAASKDALSITMQAANAVSVVEAAKKTR
jgi:hypothetical protein